MEDREIVDLYWKRSEKAIEETATKYGKMLQRLSVSIVDSEQDAEECVNDSYVSAWNSMPENRPNYLGAYMAKIARNHSLNVIEKRKAAKRNADLLPLEELSECIADPNGPGDWDDDGKLKKVIEEFLEALEPDKRTMFVRRYFFNDSEKDIAKSFGLSEGNVRIIFYRMRLGLKNRLEKEGLR